MPPTLIAMHPVPIHLEITNTARAKGLHMVMVFCIKPFDDPSLSDISNIISISMSLKE